MKTEVKIPEVGESVREALLSQWYRRDGDLVRKGEILFIIETDKVTLEVVAEADGILRILTPEGATVPVGAVVGTIETESAPAGRKEGPTPGPREETATPTSPVPEAPPVVAMPETRMGPAMPPGKPQPEPLPSSSKAVPSALSLAEEKGVDLAKVSGTGPDGLITRGDVLLYLEESVAHAQERCPGR